MKSVITLVLGGGRGTRLYPLTKFRSKPAVPLAGKYRLIDVPLSNCINSGLNRIYVLTQFHSVSLHGHIRSTYSFGPLTRGFVEILVYHRHMLFNKRYGMPGLVGWPSLFLFDFIGMFIGAFGYL